MSFYDYRVSRTLVKADPPFYSLIMAAMARADTVNATMLRSMWPEVWEEVQARYNAPGALLPGETNPTIEGETS